VNKSLVVFPLLLALVACGDGSKIKDTIREHLKDPSSAEFKALVTNESGNKACIVYHAKNSMGGYGDWHAAFLDKNKSGWVVRGLEGVTESCSENELKAIAAGEKAELDAEIKAIETIRTKKNISREEAMKSCGDLIAKFAVTSGMAVKSRMIRASGNDFEESMLKEQQDLLDKADCSSH